jgi:6-phosphogluconolactonase
MSSGGRVRCQPIASYAIDPETGALKPIGRYPTGKGSNWVEIVSFD